MLLARIAIAGGGLEQFATGIGTCSAPVREVEVGWGRPKGPRRCRTSGTRSWPSGSAGSPVSCAGTRGWVWRTSRCGTSATSLTRVPSGVVPARRDDRARPHAAPRHPPGGGDDGPPSGCGRTSSHPRGAVQPAGAHRAGRVRMTRDGAYQLVQESARRGLGRGDELPRADRRGRARPRSRRGVRLRRLPRARPRGDGTARRDRLTDLPPGTTPRTARSRIR